MMIKGDNISYANIYKFDNGIDADISLYIEDTSGNNYIIAFSLKNTTEIYTIRLIQNGTELWKIPFIDDTTTT